jgi:hypothetical protein
MPEQMCLQMGGVTGLAEINRKAYDNFAAAAQSSGHFSGATLKRGALARLTFAQASLDMSFLFISAIPGPRKSRKHTGSSSVLLSTLPFSYLLGVHARVLSQAMSWGSSWAGGYKFLSPVEAWWGDLALVTMGIASDLQECAPHQRNTKVHASNCYGAAARSKSRGEREPSRSKE